MFFDFWYYILFDQHLQEFNQLKLQNILILYNIFRVTMMFLLEYDISFRFTNDILVIS